MIELLVRHLSIRNFRGIRSLDWSIKCPVKCLIGPGDSTKTTILDAIEWALLPHWNLQIDDSDFYQTNTANMIEITATVGKLPTELLSDAKFGLYLRGWNPEDGINDEPKETDELVLSICLKIDETLEPQWTVVNDRSEGKTISHRDRAKLCINRLGTFPERHLSWSRGSTLLKITEDKSAANAAVLSASRQIRKLTDLSQIEDFNSVAVVAEKAAEKVGIKPKIGFMPNVDSKILSTNISAICLHDGDVPLRVYGLGTRRLITFGLQLDCSSNGAIVLVDEIEHGLEPYRLRRLLRVLQTEATNNNGQVILTSHSPVSVVELNVDNICIVRSDEGITKCLEIPDDMQATIRTVPEALLARKVLVCEGKTEFGLCLALENYWINEGKPNLAYLGVTLIEGGGDTSPIRAQQLKMLGYDTCLLIDSDKLDELNPSIEELKGAGVKVFYWKDKVCTEERIFLDLPFYYLEDAFNLAIEIKGKDSVVDAVLARLSLNRNQVGDTPSSWLGNGVNEEEIRRALGKVAKEKSWFKRIDYGQEIGQIVTNALAAIQDTCLADTISQIEGWLYA